MKKLFFAALAMLAINTSAFAFDDEPEEGLTWQGQIGMNISNITNSNMNAKVGANIGFYGQYMLPNAHGTFVNFGASYNMKGAQKTDDANAVTCRITNHMIQLPVHIGFQYNVIPELGVFADFGPYASFSFAGRATMDFESDIIPDVSRSLFKNKNDEMISCGLFDWGLGYRVGAEYNEHYALTIGMDWGMMDILRDNYRKDWAQAYNVNLPKYKNYNMYITLGYRF